MCVVKTKALIGFSITSKLVCAFVFRYADCWFSHEVADMLVSLVPRYNVSWLICSCSFDKRL